MGRHRDLNPGSLESESRKLTTPTHRPLIARKKLRTIYLNSGHVTKILASDWIDLHTPFFYASFHLQNGHQNHHHHIERLKSKNDFTLLPSILGFDIRSCSFMDLVTIILVLHFLVVNKIRIL